MVQQFRGQCDSRKQECRAGIKQKINENQHVSKLATINGNYASSTRTFWRGLWRVMQSCPFQFKHLLKPLNYGFPFQPKSRVPLRVLTYISALITGRVSCGHPRQMNLRSLRCGRKILYHGLRHGAASTAWSCSNLAHNQLHSSSRVRDHIKRILNWGPKDVQSTDVLQHASTFLHQGLPSVLLLMFHFKQICLFFIGYILPLPSSAHWSRLFKICYLCNGALCQDMNFSLKMIILKCCYLSMIISDWYYSFVLFFS